MNKGTKVRLTGIVSNRGTVFASLRPEYEQRIIGRIMSESACPIGCVQVKFPSCPEGVMEVPLELLERMSTIKQQPA